MLSVLTAPLLLISTQLAAQQLAPPIIAHPTAPPAIPDASALPTIPGTWTYANTADGSEAMFATSANVPQAWVHCTRLTRTITIARPATGAAAYLGVWTSSMSRNVPASFNPATARLTINLATYDPLLDAIAGSRGRFALNISTQPPLILPPWPEPARVIDDCRG